MIRCACLLVLLVSAVPAAESPASFLLPDDVRPISEKLELTVDPSKDVFEGWSKIDVELKTRRQIIWLNGKDLSVESASVQSQGVTLSAKAEPAGGEFISVTPEAPVGPVFVTVSLRYHAHLSQSANSGPYRRAIKGQWYAFTMFTPIDARRAFPCLDEPRFKIPWEVSIQVPQDDRAFSNAPLVDAVNQPDGRKLFRFAPTKPLPAEIVAFVVGPFDVWTADTAGINHVPVRVITPQGESLSGKAAGVATRTVLPRLEAYTGMPYPWEKLDHVALPEGAFGAVENPGLITYLAKGLLALPGADTVEKDHAIRALQAHELSHQWFGDLVTQSSWKDVWLSEGFATWLAFKMMDEETVAASRHLREISAREDMMQHDSEKGFAVRSAINSRADTENVYNNTVYHKGAAILLMLENWLGPAAFQHGLQLYLHQHAFSSATTDDLATALQNTSHIDPRSVLMSFLDQKGVPRIAAQIDCKGDNGQLSLRQVNAAAEWSVPVCWRGNAEPSTCTVVGPRMQSSLPIQLTSCPAWLFLNAGGTGYYRTVWTSQQLSRFSPQHLSLLTAAERLTLVFDLRALPLTSVTSNAVNHVLQRLAQDPEPEVRRAAQQALAPAISQAVQ